MKRCEVCGTLVMEDRESGEWFCPRCGTVQDDLIDWGPEWRLFPDEGGERVRAGPPPTVLVSDRGLTTVIMLTSREKEGMSAGTRRKFERLARWQTRARCSKSRDKNLAIALDYTLRFCEKLALPKSVAEGAAELYRRALDSGLLKGRAIKEIAAACTYLALRLQPRGASRSLAEVARALNIYKRDLARAYRLVVRSLGVRVPPPNVMPFIERVALHANIPYQTTILAKRIAAIAKERGLLSGRDPRGLAAGLVAYACELDGVERSRKELARAAGVTEPTMRKRLEELKGELGFNTREEVETTATAILAETRR